MCFCILYIVSVFVNSSNMFLLCLLFFVLDAFAMPRTLQTLSKQYHNLSVYLTFPGEPLCAGPVLGAALLLPGLCLLEMVLPLPLRSLRFRLPKCRRPVQLI